MQRITMQIPPSGENTDSGWIAIESGGAYGMDDGVNGNRGGAKAGKGRRVAVAERNKGSCVVLVEIFKQAVEHPSHRNAWRCLQLFVCFEPPLVSICTSSVFHFLPPIDKDIHLHIYMVEQRRKWRLTTDYYSQQEIKNRQ